MAKNQTNAEATILSGPSREGLALLQGLLLCGICGRRLTVRYRGNGGLYPVYECNWLRREGTGTKACLAVRCDLFDHAVAECALRYCNQRNSNLPWSPCTTSKHATRR